MESLLRPPPIESLEAYKHISQDSGYPTVIHSHYNTKIKAHIPPEPPLTELILAKDRASYADPEKKALLAVAKAVDLTESIGNLTPKSFTFHLPYIPILTISLRH